jgi:mercuric ion transport protein
MWKKIVDFFSVFGSTATLLCCALPALLSVIVGGAAVSAFVSSVPWVIPLSENKGWLFLATGILLVFNSFLTFRPKGKLACSITGGKGCDTAGGFSRAVLWFAIGIYLAGAFFAFALVPILELFS